MVSESATNKIEMWLARSGMFCIVGYVIGWGILGMCIQPFMISPAATAQQHFDFYQEHSTRIMIGMTIASFDAGIFMLFVSQIATQMRRREKNSQILSTVQLVGGLLTGWVGMMAAMMWCALAEFSTQLDPAMVKFFHVMTWYVFDGTYWVTIAQFGAIGLMGIYDTGKDPLFPKSTGLIGVVLAVGYATLALIPFDHTFIFSYDGLWNMYFVWITFFFYLMWVSRLCAKDLKRSQVAVERNQVGAQALAH
ncbi:hypothetical protein LLG90_25270 [Aromatoleum toluclasticum]|uniref:hypothetical protein n=1 Tax=Aromatoleum toluclasticum TaxID=92003 RepID=UPI001D18A293|nr:hypothetical protein [Aromatoleum toluclasticum]MCC4118675.1 hypothetical protein [Aromatoleum toluclasticum]